MKNKTYLYFGNSLLKNAAAAKLLTACEDGKEKEPEQLTRIFTSGRILHGRALSNKFFKSVLLNWSDAVIKNRTPMAAIFPSRPPLIKRINHKIIYTINQCLTSVTNGKNLSNKEFEIVLLMK